eukprot:5448238-Amphidinium_carterae.1
MRNSKPGKRKVNTKVRPNSTTKPVLLRDHPSHGSGLRGMFFSTLLGDSKEAPLQRPAENGELNSSLVFLVIQSKSSTFQMFKAVLWVSTARKSGRKPECCNISNMQTLRGSTPKRHYTG